MNDTRLQYWNKCQEFIVPGVKTPLTNSKDEFIITNVSRETSGCNQCGQDYPSLCLYGLLRGIVVTVHMYTYDYFICECDTDHEHEQPESIPFKIYYNGSYDTWDYLDINLVDESNTATMCPDKAVNINIIALAT